MKRLDMIVAIFQGGACPLRRSEGDVFTRIRDLFVESDRRSQPTSRGASVEELGKNLTPSKRRICQIRG
jgi:hypothetical protein